MAMVLRTITGRVGGFLDDVFAFGNGVLDGWMLVGVKDIGVWIILIKNILIPIVDKAVMPLPKGLVHSAEAILGFIIGVIIAK